MSSIILTAVMKVGKMVFFCKTFQSIPIWVTFIQGQVTWAGGNHENTITHVYANTMTTTAYQNTPHWVTFSQGQGHKVHHLLALCRGQGKNKLKRFDISGSVYSFAVHDLCDLDAC